MLAVVPAVTVVAATTRTVATAHEPSAWATRPGAVWSGAFAAAMAPPIKAAMMPETAHHTKADQPTPARAASAVGISTLRRPTPKPSMVRRICTTRDMKTPARTACHVHPKNAVEVRVDVRATCRLLEWPQNNANFCSRFRRNKRGSVRWRTFVERRCKPSRHHRFATGSGGGVEVVVLGCRFAFYWGQTNPR